MSGYLFGLATLSILIGVLGVLLPPSAAQQVKLLCSLCVICLVCAPVVSLLDTLAEGSWEIPEAWQEQEEQESDYGQLSQALVIGQLQVFLEREMGLTPETCSVRLVQDADGNVTHATLILSGKAIWRDPDPIAAYVQGLLGCPCTVVLD